MQEQQGFFDFAAEVGLTKHIGGAEATKELMDLCHMGDGQYVLDVGCGAGVTPCTIAKTYDCKVLGVDILERMAERCRARAQREGVADRVEFRVADALNLPFQNDLFDAVITESVTAFPDDKQRAVQEYVRVLKPGGYVGLSESTWLKTPPPPELVAWASQDLGGNIGPLTSEGWVELLKNAGLTGIVAQTYTIDVRDEAKGILGRYGPKGMLGILRRMLFLYAKSPAYRRFVKEAQKDGVPPKNLEEYFGYGLYVGRK